MNLRNLVTSPDPTLPVLDVHHQRYNRVLLTDTHMRKHLSYFSRKYLRKLRPEECLDPNTEAERTRELQQNLGVHCDQPVKNFILALFQRSEDQEILYCIARILYMLSGMQQWMLWFHLFASTPALQMCAKTQLKSRVWKN